MILFLEDTTMTSCGDSNLLTIMQLIRQALKLIQILVPIALIIFGTLDMAKCVIAGDEKKIKENQGKFIKRIASAIIVFLIPIIVNFVMSFAFTDTVNEDWTNCWNDAASSSSKISTDIGSSSDSNDQKGDGKNCKKIKVKGKYKNVCN